MSKQLSTAVSSTTSVTRSSERGNQRDLWRRVRQLLAANAESTGLVHLDNLVEAVIEGRTTGQHLQGVVLLLPDPAQQRPSAGPPPSTFFAASSRGRLAPREREPPAVTKKSRSKASSRVAPHTVCIPEGCRELPAEVEDDVQALFDKAAEMDTTPARMAYPWSGRSLWYDPEDYPDIYTEHWRFWMDHRGTFWDWHIHLPLDQAALSARRKKKLNAHRAQLKFVSRCIETWGYFSFLNLFEAEDSDKMLWLGGQPGKRSSEARLEKIDGVEDLVTLYNTDLDRYQAVLDSALSPDEIDADGYGDVTAWLVSTRGFDANADPERRLSDRALARVRLDMESGPPKQKHWIASSRRGVLADLKSATRLDRLVQQVKRGLENGKYQAPPAAPYSASEDHGDQESDFEVGSPGDRSHDACRIFDKLERSGDSDQGDAADNEDDEESGSSPVKPQRCKAGPARDARASTQPRGDDGRLAFKKKGKSKAVWRQAPVLEDAPSDDADPDDSDHDKVSHAGHDSDDEFEEGSPVLLSELSTTPASSKAKDKDRVKGKVTKGTERSSHSKKSASVTARKLGLRSAGLDSASEEQEEEEEEEHSPPSPRVKRPVPKSRNETPEQPASKRAKRAAATKPTESKSATDITPAPTPATKETAASKSASKSSTHDASA